MAKINKKEDIDMVDKKIYTVLVNVDSPEHGWTVREITRYIWDYQENAPTTELFYTRAKLVERRIGAIRHRIFEDIRQEMKEKGVNKVEKPVFIPYALPIANHWRYLNAANFTQMPKVIEKLRSKAEGLIKNADVLEAVF